LCFTFDGIHLNSSGADLWAQTILGALARMQRQPVAVELLAESTSFP
jgi:lysophospholipase L1-like esterase